MRKIFIILAFILIWYNAVASYTFTQSFFNDYNPATEGNFSYKNENYRNDAKQQKYNHNFSKDDSSNYNCSFDASGQIRCGDYKIKKSTYNKNNNAVKKIKEHYSSLQEVKNISQGDNFNCALDDNDNVYCWGNNKRGQLGSKTVENKITTPLKVDIDDKIKFKKIYTKAHYACALDEDGQAYCWGDGSNGEVGNGEKGHFTTPQKVKTQLRFSRLSMARTYTCGIVKKTDEIYCWGKSRKGNVNLDSSVPVKI